MEWLKQINWRRVAGITMLLLSIAGLLAGLLLETGWVLWVLAVAVSYLVIRLERVITMLSKVDGLGDD